MRPVLITRPRKDAAPLAGLLRAAGYQPVLFPTIDIRPVKDNPAWQRALEKWACYDWVVFTSANAVESVCGTGFPACPPRTESRRTESPAYKDSPHIAAIGAKTAAALRKRDIEPDLVPAEHTAEALLPLLGDLRGRWVLFPCSDIALDTLPRGVAAAGGVVHQIVVYRTLPSSPEPAGLDALRRGVAWLTFTSPSTVENFVRLLQPTDLDPRHLPGSPKVACIGPTTAAAARDADLRVDAVAAPHTIEGMVRAMQQSDSHR